MGLRRGAATVAVGGALLGVLAGCGGDDTGPATDPGTTPTAAATPGSPTPSEPPASPEVTPAAGPRLSMEAAEVSAPTTWEREEQLVPLEDGARGPEGRLSLTQTPAFGSTLEEIARVRLKGDRASLKRLPDTEVAGVPVVHITDRGPRGDYRLTTEEGFTAVHLDQVVTLLFQLDRDVPEEQRRRLVDEVLASVVWK